MFLALKGSLLTIIHKRKVLAHCRVHVNSGTSLIFYGGVHEIGGNKFLIEDKGTKIFLVCKWGRSINILQSS
jgi:hypothetical protein